MASFSVIFIADVLKALLIEQPGMVLGKYALILINFLLSFVFFFFFKL